MKNLMEGSYGEATAIGTIIWEKRVYWRSRDNQTSFERRSKICGIILITPKII
jgi:hypothetical protein